MPDTPLAFLAERGLTLEFHDGRRRHAGPHLRSLADPAFVIHGYSRADDTQAAAALAAERWRREQRRLSAQRRWRLAGALGSSRSDSRSSAASRSRSAIASASASRPKQSLPA